MTTGEVHEAAEQPQDDGDVRAAAALLAAKAPCCGGPHAGWIHTAECATPQQPARDTADGGAE